MPLAVDLRLRQQPSGEARNIILPGCCRYASPRPLDYHDGFDAVADTRADDPHIETRSKQGEDDDERVRSCFFNFLLCLLTNMLPRHHLRMAAQVGFALPE